MADIYLGIRLDQRFLERFVAVKRIHRVGNSSQYQKIKTMFADEARIISTLSHPHIVQILDFTEKGENFHIVMEYIDGENLGYILNVLRRREEKVPLDIGVRLMVQALEALQYIHTAKSLTGEPLNIVHRDLDPRNLMLDSNGYLKIIDFGIAKTVIQTELTAPDLFKGKLSHVAPEVFSQSEIDHRADVYSLGLVLYEIATGERPYHLDKSAVLAETIKRIINDPLQNPREINPEIPEQLEHIILKACDKDREKRFQSADELHIALTDFATGSENSCGIASNADIKDWFSERFQERLTRRRNFEFNALQKAKQALDKNKAERESIAMPPVPDGTRDSQLSIQPTVASSGCQVTGIESLTGASFSTGMMEKTSEAPAQGDPHAAERNAYSPTASQTANTMPPSPIQTFISTTPPPAMDTHHSDDEDTFAGHSRKRIFKIAVVTASTAIAAALILIVVFGGDPISEVSHAADDSVNKKSESVTVTESVVAESTPPSESDGTPSPEIQMAQLESTADTGDSAASPSDHQNSTRNTRTAIANRNWISRRSKPRPTSADETAAVSEDLTSVGEIEINAQSEPIRTTENAATAEIADGFKKTADPSTDKESATSTLPQAQNVASVVSPTRDSAASVGVNDLQSQTAQFISGSGDWSGPKALKSGCGSCHGVDATSKTTSQWEYFFSHNRHRRKANLKALFSPKELRRIEAHLISIVKKSKNLNSGIAGVR